MGNQIIILSVIGTFDPAHINKLVQASQESGLEILHASTHYDSKLRCAIGTPEDLIAAINILQEGPRDVVIQSDATQPAVSLNDILAAVNAGRKEVKALLTPDKKKKGQAGAAPVLLGGSQDKTIPQTSEETDTETKTEVKENHPGGGGEADSKTEPEIEDTSETTQTDSETSAE
jgi:hypothetical protein